jgi:hypothetical protein
MNPLKTNASRCSRYPRGTRGDRRRNSAPWHRDAVDFVGLFGQSPAVTDLGQLAALPLVGGVLYAVGAILFGIAILRARVLSRGAGILLIAAAVVTPIAGVLLRHPLDRIAAIPMGLALIWLGYSLWSHHREDTVAPPTTSDQAPLKPAAAV